MQVRRCRERMEDEMSIVQRPVGRPAELRPKAAAEVSGGGQNTAREKRRAGGWSDSMVLRYAVAVAATLLATVMREWLDPFLHDSVQYSIYYAAIMFTAWYAGLGPSLVAMISGALLANYLFVEPRGTFFVASWEHKFSLGVYLAVSSFVAFVCESLRRDVRRREQVEEALSQRTATLEQYAARLRELNTRLQKEDRRLRDVMESQDRDRQLIGFEIHDGLAQLLVGAVMRLESFPRLHEKEPAEAWKHFETGLQLLNDAIREARRLINGLRPPSLDAAGLTEAIADLVRDVAVREHVEVEFVHDVEFERLPRPLENCIFRIVQESLTNACRHSKSEKVRVRLRREENRLCIEVQDWGIGFDPQSAHEGHYGIESIRERARLFGGEAAIESRPDEGTRVAVWFPLPEKQSLTSADSGPTSGS
ncbi:MAG: DUF4118 domain-containing protein [Thermoguttaceae bacterium]